MDLKRLTEKTIEVNRKFKNWEEWDVKTRLIVVLEELGELAYTILVKEKKKKDKVSWEESFQDALCDVIYNLLIMAYEEGVDLEKEYLEMLKKLERRIENGEFE